MSSRPELSSLLRRSLNRRSPLDAGYVQLYNVLRSSGHPMFSEPATTVLNGTDHDKLSTFLYLRQWESTFNLKLSNGTDYVDMCNRRENPGVLYAKPLYIPDAAKEARAVSVANAYCNSLDPKYLTVLCTARAVVETCCPCCDNTLPQPEQPAIAAALILSNELAAVRAFEASVGQTLSSANDGDFHQFCQTHNTRTCYCAACRDLDYASDPSDASHSPQRRVRFDENAPPARSSPVSSAELSPLRSPLPRRLSFDDFDVNIDSIDIPVNSCVGCGEDLGAQNPRQYCQKFYCPYMTPEMDPPGSPLTSPYAPTSPSYNRDD